MTRASSSRALVADIGGTHARFALTDPQRLPVVLQAPQTLRSADFASLQHAAEHYLAGMSVRPRQAAIAVACPAGGEEFRLTNRAWSFTRSELRHRLGLEQLLVLNDFGAVAQSVPHLSTADRVHLYGPNPSGLWGPVSVLGPGTGLGVAILVGDAAHGWQVVETEGGHIGFAPQGEEEQAIAQWIGKRFGRVSNERLLSGTGLSHIEAALCSETSTSAIETASELRDPAPIVSAALEGHDLLARRTLARFCAVLGSVAGDAALIHGARTVMIAGGIVPRFLPFLHSSLFRERFLAKGRFATYLEAVSVQVITHPAPGLLGAAVALFEQRNGLAAGETAV